MEREMFLKKLREVSSTELAIRNRAATVHAEVNQTYGCGYPYSKHLNVVAYFAATYMPDVLESEKDIIPILFGAYFHDSIEDARLTYNDVMKIAREYMDEDQAYMATEIVYALTNEKGRNRHERANDKYYTGIRETKYAPLVKAADRLANYEYAKSTEGKKSMEKAYREEMPGFIHDALTKKDGTYFVPEKMIDELKD
jgi:(p)ppGpp synthase/HD superfamily hydrolase